MYYMLYKNEMGSFSCQNCTQPERIEFIKQLGYIRLHYVQSVHSHCVIKYIHII